MAGKSSTNSKPSSFWACVCSGVLGLMSLGALGLMYGIDPRHKLKPAVIEVFQRKYKTEGTEEFPSKEAAGVFCWGVMDEKYPNGKFVYVSGQKKLEEKRTVFNNAYGRSVTTSEDEWNDVWAEYGSDIVEKCEAWEKEETEYKDNADETITLATRTFNANDDKDFQPGWSFGLTDEEFKHKKEQRHIGKLRAQSGLSDEKWRALENFNKEWWASRLAPPSVSPGTWSSDSAAKLEGKRLAENKLSPFRRAAWISEYPSRFRMIFFEFSGDRENILKDCNDFVERKAKYDKEAYGFSTYLIVAAAAGCAFFFCFVFWQRYKEDVRELQMLEDSDDDDGSGVPLFFEPSPSVNHQTGARQTQVQNLTNLQNPPPVQPSAPPANFPKPSEGNAVTVLV